MIGADYRLLGPFEVTAGGRGVLVGGAQRRGLLAVLLLASPHAVSVDKLIDSLWTGDPPASAVNMLQGYVSDWRRALEPDRARRHSGGRLQSVPGGYRLEVRPGEADVHRFGDLARRGGAAAAAGELKDATTLLEAALDQWRGNALEDFANAPFRTTAAERLDSARLDVVELFADLLLRLDRPADALPRLTRVAADHPLRERLVSLRIRALLLLGRRAEALRAYEQIRVALRDELGVDPGAELRDLHVRLLRQRTPPPPGTPTPTAAGPAPATLPLPLTTFVGRERELEHIGSALDAGHRLVTLAGPVGSGKTRLALHFAHSISGEDRPGGRRRGVAFADLVAVQRPDSVLAAVADAVGVRLAAGEPPARALAHWTRERDLLVVLDNAERMLAAAPLLTEVLAEAPHLAWLVTSREPLGMAGELVVPVPPLAVPSAAEREPAVLRESEAVRLLLDRLRSASGLKPSEEELPLLAAICRRLDGLPLALELVAPWSRTLSLGGLLEELDHALGLLTTGGGDRPPRHRTMRAAIEWSCRDLAAPQNRLLERMSVLCAGAAIEAVAALADPGDECLPALRALVDKHLVQRLDDAGQPRYRLLETVREYIGERLATRPDRERDARDRHAQLIADVMAARAREGSPGQRQVGTLPERALADEQAETRAALAHLTARSPVLHLALAVDAFAMWWDRGSLREGYDALRNAIPPPDSPPALRAAREVAMSHLASALGDQTEALSRARAGADLAGRAGPAGGVLLEAAALASAGDMLMWTQPAEGRRLLSRAMQLAALPGEGSAPRWAWASAPFVTAATAYSLAESLRFREPARALELLTKQLSILPSADPRGLGAFLRRSLGWLAIDRGDYPLAESWLQASLDGARHAGSLRSEARSHAALADLAWAQGDITRAIDSAGRSVELSRDAGHAYNLARAAARLGQALLEAGDATAAERVLAAAMEAVVERDPAAADRLLAPSRARLARLTGALDQAGVLLSAADAEQPPDELRPERVTFLVESALLARARGHDVAAGEATGRLLREAAAIGLVLAAPDRRNLRELTPADPARSGQPPADESFRLK